MAQTDDAPAVDSVAEEPAADAQALEEPVKEELSEEASVTVLDDVAVDENFSVNLAKSTETFKDETSAIEIEIASTSAEIVGIEDIEAPEIELSLVQGEEDNTETEMPPKTAPPEPVPDTDNQQVSTESYASAGDPADASAGDVEVAAA